MKGIASNILAYKTGAINIDASRVKATTHIPNSKSMDFTGTCFFGKSTRNTKKNQVYKPHPQGRFPSNLLVTNSTEISVMNKLSNNNKTNPLEFFKKFRTLPKGVFCSKPSTKEKGTENSHSTVKPIKFMKYLIEMITPPGGIVIDPFLGSGTTGVAAIENGFKFIGIENEKEYLELAKRRIYDIQKK